MAFKAVSFKSQPEAEPKIIRLARFKGINMSTTETQIDDAETPDMLNKILDSTGALDTRFGYQRVFTTSLGAGKINGMYEFKKENGDIIFFIHHTTILYTQSGSSQPVSFKTGLANAKSRFFTFNNYCYIMDGTNFFRTDGTTTVTVDSVAYVPTLTLGRAPTGGGTAFEDFNLMGAGFKDSFSGTAAVVDYTMSLIGLDATAVTAVVNSVAMVETTNFTVNRTTGIVTFAIAPGVGVNNVLITAYKTVAGNANKIKQAAGFEIYGGTNDTRVFVFSLNILYRCGVNDPTYWGDLKFAKVGSSGVIKGLRKQYSNCLIIKEPHPNGTTVYSMSYGGLDADGEAVFNIETRNSIIGCEAADSIQIIENDPVFASSTGVHGIYGSNVSDERNLQRISDDINPALLSEDDLSDAVSADYDKKYILCLNNRCYVQDYKIKYADSNGLLKSPWYIWNNIPASCFLERESYLYFGSNTTGLVYRFNKADDTNVYSDDGTAIDDYWKSKIFSFNDDEHLKTVIKTFFSLKPNSRASADLYYVTDKTISALILTARRDLFDYSLWDYSTFTYRVSRFPQEVAAKVNAKKISYFQLILRNQRDNDSMGILSIGLKVAENREYK